MIEAACGSHCGSVGISTIGSLYNFDIDYSNIPPLTDSQLAQAIKGRFLLGRLAFPHFPGAGVLDTLTEVAACKEMVVNDLVNDVLKWELATANVLR